MTTNNEKNTYEAPVVKVIEFSTESIICQTSNTDMNPGEDLEN